MVAFSAFTAVFSDDQLFDIAIVLDKSYEVVLSHTQTCSIQHIKSFLDHLSISFFFSQNQGDKFRFCQEYRNGKNYNT